MGLLLLLPFPLFSPLSAFFLHIAAVVFGFFCSAPFLFCQCRFFFLCQYDFLMGDFYLADKVKENLNLLCAARPFSLGLGDKDFFNKFIYHGGGKLGKIRIFFDKGKEFFSVDGFPAYTVKLLLVLGNALG